MNIKTKILSNTCYTELVYGRINKKLKCAMSRSEIETYLYAIIQNTDCANIVEQGKNYYITNLSDKIRITINSRTYRVITVDRL